MEIYGDSLQFRRIDFFFFDHNRRHLSLNRGNNISRNNATFVDNKSRFFSLETWKESIYRRRISSSWTSFAFIRFFSTTCTSRSGWNSARQTALIPYQFAIAEVCADSRHGEGGEGGRRRGEGRRFRARLNARETASLVGSLTPRFFFLRILGPVPVLAPGFPLLFVHLPLPFTFSLSLSLPLFFSLSLHSAESLSVYLFSLLSHYSSSSLFSFTISFILFHPLPSSLRFHSSPRFSSVHADASTPILPDSKQRHAVPTPLIHISHERIPNYLDADVFRPTGASRTCNEGTVRPSVSALLSSPFFFYF